MTLWNYTFTFNFCIEIFNFFDDVQNNFLYFWYVEKSKWYIWVNKNMQYLILLSFTYPRATVVKHFCQRYYFDIRLLLLVVTPCLPIFAIVCLLSLAMATVSTLYSGFTVLVMKSQSIQEIHGLSDSVQLLQHAWSMWVHRSVPPSLVEIQIVPTNGCRCWEIYIWQLSTNDVLGLLCIPLHLW